MTARVQIHLLRTRPRSFGRTCLCMCCVTGCDDGYGTRCSACADKDMCTNYGANDSGCVWRTDDNGSSWCDGGSSPAHRALLSHAAHTPPASVPAADCNPGSCLGCSQSDCASYGGTWEHGSSSCQQGLRNACAALRPTTAGPPQAFLESGGVGLRGERQREGKREREREVHRLHTTNHTHTRTHKATPVRLLPSDLR